MNLAGLLPLLDAPLIWLLIVISAAVITFSFLDSGGDVGEDDDNTNNQP